MNQDKGNNWLSINQPCALCRLAPARHTGLCDDCHADLPWLIGGCSRCAEPMPPPARGLCARCQQQPPAFENTVAAFSYEFPISQLIPALKYRRRPAPLGWLSATFAELIAERLEDTPDLLVPVPMHPWQELSRGFNQASLIAERLSRLLKIPLSEQLLQKRRRTAHQAELNRQQRQANLRRSFSCRGPVPARVALIDDVMTTGTTVNELARLLKRRGAQQIQVWVLARTPAHVD